jgi:uncharacterized protein YndB with AHSA1/START domain
VYTLTVSRKIPAPINDVFDAFTDHEKLSQVLGVRRCTLVQQGSPEKNGLGALREVDCGVIRLREEITAFDRPHRMEYRIRDSRPKADHEFGRVEFTSIPEGTEVTWMTRFGVRLPGAGNLVDRVVGIGFGVAFRLVLRNVEQRVMAAKGLSWR